MLPLSLEQMELLLATFAAAAAAAADVAVV